MRRITVSVLSIFIALPAFSATRLPVVNIGAAGVSARDAFGEGATAQKGSRPRLKRRLLHVMKKKHRLPCR